MPTIDVLPPVLVSGAAAARCFSHDVSPVALQTEVLSDALRAFSQRWSQELRALEDDARAVAVALQEAAAGYVELDALLVPRALR